MQANPVQQGTRHPLVIIAIATILLSLICSSEKAFADPSDGRWKGEWKSEVSGHHGPLRARIRKLDSDEYRALFAGRFFKIIPFVYATKLHRVPQNDSSESPSGERLRSIQRLPLLGTYEMEAVVTKDKFHAEYKSKRDSGIFSLSR